MEMPALALTDHLSLTGALPFYQACLDVNVQPILGVEIDLRLPGSRAVRGRTKAIQTGRLALLALDWQGWQNISRLSSLMLCAADDEPAGCTLDTLERYSTGVICLTGGIRGPLHRLLSSDTRVRQLLSRLQELFGDRLYVEVNTHSPTDAAVNDRLLEFARELHISPAAAHSIFYLEPAQTSLQRTASAIRAVVPAAGLPDEACAPPNAYFCAPAEMQQHFAHIPGALEASHEIAARCRLELPLHQQNYPHVPTPPGLSPDDLLRRKAEDGARRLYAAGKRKHSLPKEVQHRLDAELQVIAERGYAPIFLIAEEMVAFAREKGIPTASRGSASSSLVAHCTGITTPDPLELDLYFERFLNPARTTPPDIDTDFCSRRRDEVIEHLFETYGRDKVAMIGTINTFRPRSALGEAAKAHGLSPKEVHSLTAKVGYRYYHPGAEADEADKSPYTALMAQYGGNPRYRQIFEDASGLIGMPHHLSVHPGGVVIGPGPIVDTVPVARSGGKGVIITQFDLNDVEKMGLVKLDLLGIRGLTVLGDMASSVHSWRRTEFDSPLLVLDSVPADDPETAALVSSGRTIGCFQIESPGMRATLRDIQACTIPDVMAALALYRPGPLKGGLRDAFVRRHNHQEAVTHIHPALSGLLRETYGVILYQEQVLRIAHELAGLTLAEADLLRRAMSHFDPGKKMQELRDKFISGALARSQVDENTARRIWEMMAAFAGYGFPKAHAASYAVVAWRSAWCKAHHPAEFLAAVLANWGGYYQQSVYLNEVRRLGFRVRAPHVNHSQRQFTVTYLAGEPVLFMGLDQISGLTRRTQTRILRYRPFHGLSDFIARVDPRAQELENLIQAAAFDGLGTIPDLLRTMHGERLHPGQLSLFPLESPTTEDWTDEQKAEAQIRLLGISLELHPLEKAASQIRTAGAITTVDAAARIGDSVLVAGMRQTFRRSLTSGKEWMGFLTIEDLEGMLDVVLFPSAYSRSRADLSSSAGPFVVEGVMEREPTTGEPLLRAERVWRVR